MGHEIEADGAAANAANPAHPGKAGAPKPSPVAGKGVGKPDDDSSASAANAAVDLEAQNPPDLGVESGINGWAISTVLLGLVVIIGTVLFCQQLGMFTSGSAATAVQVQPGTTCLVIIDPQVDFHDGLVKGSLPVKNSEKDVVRLANWIQKQGDKIDNITVSLDSHTPLHVGHPLFWVDKDGKHPPERAANGAPVSISHEAVKNGVWKASDPKHQQHAEDYTKQLEATAKKTKSGIDGVQIWPYHCIMGSPGHAIHPELEPVLQQWAKGSKPDRPRMINYVYKGQNPLTEMFSMFKAEVVLDDTVYGGAFNQPLFDRIASYETIIFAGQAKSHCVKHSMLDFLKVLPKGRRGSVYLLSDCSSPVGFPIFEQQAEKFENDLAEMGCHVVKVGDGFTLPPDSGATAL